MRWNGKGTPNKARRILSVLALACCILSVLVLALCILLNVIVAIHDSDPGSILFALVTTLTIIVVAITVIGAFHPFGKKCAGKKRATRDEQRERAAFQSGSADHEHITQASYGHEPRKRLEQLETLKGAGLITEEEYREKRKEILRKQ